jgi:hypothetical protein
MSEAERTIERGHFVGAMTNKYICARDETLGQDLRSVCDPSPSTSRNSCARSEVSSVKLEKRENALRTNNSQWMSLTKRKRNLISL